MIDTALTPIKEYMNLGSEPLVNAHEFLFSIVQIPNFGMRKIFMAYVNNYIYPTVYITKKKN